MTAAAGFEDEPLPGTVEQCPTRRGTLERCALEINHLGDHATAEGETWRNRRRGAYPEAEAPAPRKAAARRPSSRRPRKPLPVEHPEGRWAVVYRHGKAVQVWAWIEDVPERTAAAAVSEALAQWPRWPGWQRRISPGGHVDVMPAAKIPAGVWPVPAVSLTWAELTPEDRKVSLNVSAALWADLRAEAAADEQSLGAWCVDALTAAVAARKAARS